MDLAQIMLGLVLLTTVHLVASAGDDTNQMQPTSNGGRIWTIAHGHDWGAHEYFDSKGYIKGFSLELIQAVCEAAGMDCRTVWAPYYECWMSAPAEHSKGGRGLSDGWFDACVGWGATVDRIHVYSFSLPYIKMIPSYFWVKKGNAGSFNFANLDGKKIGFLNGWAYDEKCLARHEDARHTNYVLPKERIIYADTAAYLIPNLLDGTVDALLGSYNDYQYYLDQDQIEVISSDPFWCFLSGNGVVARKDSDFNTFWNKGFLKIRSNGKFQQLCEAAKAHSPYGYVSCID